MGAVRGPVALLEEAVLPLPTHQFSSCGSRVIRLVPVLPAPGSVYGNTGQWLSMQAAVLVRQSSAMERR